MSDMQLALDSKRWLNAATTIKREFQEFTTFLKRPKRGTGKQANGWAWLGRVAGFLFLLLLLYIPLSVVSIWAHTKVQVDSVLDFGQFGIGIFLIAGFVGPLIEEIIFRAGLRSAGYSLYLGPIAIAIFVAVRDATAFFVLIAQVLIIFIVWIMHLRNVENTITKIRYSRRFLASYPIIFWLYAIAFSQMHIRNYSFEGATAALTIALFQIPQFLAGVVLAYLRLRDGLRSSITLHCLHNLLALWLAAHADKCPGWIRFMCE